MFRCLLLFQILLDKYYKFDASFEDKDDIIIYTSLVMRLDNPNFKAIVEGYFLITQEAEQDK